MTDFVAKLAEEEQRVAQSAAIMEKVVIGGDLSKLTPAERLFYYRQVCESMGLNPLTKPFQYITLNGRLTLYAARDATDQLRKIHKVSITRVFPQKMDDLYVVVAEAEDSTGRKDSATGAVSLAGLRGEVAANAMMKAETKAKRRVTLSLCGLGLLDESEADSVPDARKVAVDAETGEILTPAMVVEAAAGDLATGNKVAETLAAVARVTAAAATMPYPPPKDELEATTRQVVEREAQNQEAEEKAILLGRIQAGFDKLRMPAADQVALWTKLLGSVGFMDVTGADVGALGDLLRELQGRYKGRKP
jgi:hypothetical protein